MQVFCSEDQTAVLMYRPDAVERVLPLPTVLDSHTVVLLHLLLQEQQERPVVLDASGVQRLHPVGVLLLSALLRRRGEVGAPVRVAGLSYPLRRQLERHPLTEYLSAEGVPVPSLAFTT